MTVIFRCGHQQDVDADTVSSPACLECGERVVARTVGVGRPNFVGIASGPCATTRGLPAMAVSLTVAESGRVQ